MKRIMAVIIVFVVLILQAIPSKADQQHPLPSQTPSSIGLGLGLLPLPFQSNYASKIAVEVNLFSASSDSSYTVNDSNAKISRNRRSLLLNHGEIREDRAYSAGDVIIGGLFPVHIPNNGIFCGKIQIGSGMWTESLIYAVNVVNNDSRLLPNFTLGYEIRDDCSDTSRALQQTLNFININSEGSQTCSSKVKTVGVVGTGKSSTSKAVSDLLTLFKIPQISYSASASEFSKKSRFPYFFRTVPSDRHQAQVMCEIAKKFQWNLVDIIYSDDNYGSEGREELEKNLREADICVSESLILLNNKQNTEDIVGILKKSKADIIFTFCGKDYISRILEEASIQNMTKKTWIACDSWANSKEVIGDNKHVVEGMLGVLPMSGVDRGFEQYLLRIDPLKNENPFYKHTLEIHHNCTFSNSSEKRQCTSSDSFEDIIATSNTWSAFVMDSVYAFAHALDNMYKNNGSYENYADYIKNVSFEGVTKDKFGFDSNGDPYASYEVLNLQKISDNVWKFKKVFEWDPDEGFQKTPDTLVQWKDGLQQPVGRCSKSCPAGTYQKAGKELKCCWTCDTCQDKSYTKTTDEKVCKLCEAGFSVNADHTDCIKNKVVYLEWSSTVTLFLILLVIFSMMLTLGCLTVFVRYRNTPIIKATSTELSYVLIIGIMFSFMCTFLFMGKPTNFICNVRLVMMGVSFSIYVGTLLMKTNRISRIFNRKLSDGRPSIYLNIKYQLLFIVVIVMILVVLQGMLIFSSPSIQAHYKANTVTYIQCKHSSFAEPLAVIVYNLMLALLCGYQAFRIRKLPGQFNDSRSISFTILTCCLIWFIFLSSMFTKNGYNKSIINCIGFIANGLAALFCMFFPKIWIIYMHPEMNIRQSTMNLKNASRITINTSSNNHSNKTNGTSLDCLTNSNQSVIVQKMEDSSNEISENFMEHLCEKEDEVALMEHERGLVMEQANILYKDLEEMRIRHEDCIKTLSKLYELEHQSLQEVMELSDLKETDIVRLLEKMGFEDGKVAEEKNTKYSVFLKDLHGRHNKECSIDEGIVDESTGMLEPISKRTEQTIQELHKERQHLRYTIIQQLYGMTQDDEQVHTEQGDNFKINSRSYENDDDDGSDYDVVENQTNSNYIEDESNF